MQVFFQGLNDSNAVALDVRLSSTLQRAHQPVNQPDREPINQLTNQPVNQPINSQPTINQPINSQSTNQPMYCSNSAVAWVEDRIYPAFNLKKNMKILSRTEMVHSHIYYHSDHICFHDTLFWCCNASSALQQNMNYIYFKDTAWQTCLFRSMVEGISRQCHSSPSTLSHFTTQLRLLCTTLRLSVCMFTSRSVSWGFFQWRTQ